MVMITDPDKIDFNLLVNETYTEVAVKALWHGEAAGLSHSAQAAGTDLVYVTDAEGDELFIAARPVAEWICRELNQTCEICLTRCGKKKGQECQIQNP